MGASSRRHVRCATSPRRAAALARSACAPLGGISLLVGIVVGAHAMVAPRTADVAPHADVAAQLRHLPLAFEENRGQSDRRVRYVSRGSGYEVQFTTRGADIVLGGQHGPRPSAIGIRVVNGRRNVEPVASEPLPGTANHLMGDDPSGHIVDVGTFARVTYASVYPGIDLAYYGSAGQLEYDFIVAPRADPRRIRVAFDGADELALSPEGDLVLRRGAASIAMRKPVAYQEIHGARRDVTASYALAGSNRVGFHLGPYDADHPLVIDPILVLATNLWGSVAGVALDSSRNIYVAGTIAAAGLPATGGYQTQLAGKQDAYVAKLNPAGTSVIYATYLGARRATTSGLGVAVDAAGSAYVTGTTDATAFPITPGAYRASGSTFVTKLAPAGNALVYSTFVTATVSAMVVDGAGSVYMTGTTGALETTPGAFQATSIGSVAAYAAKLNATGSAMAYATFIGGSADDAGKGIAVDANGSAYVVGFTRSANFPTANAVRATLSGASDAFVAKVNPTGTALEYSTYLGGSGDERGFAIAVDAAGQAYVTGWTKSTDFPRTSGVFQPSIGYPDPAISNAFVTKLNSAGTGLVYSSYLGGKWCFTSTVYACLAMFEPDEGIDVGTSIAVDASGHAYVGGYATSTEFPLVDSLQAMSADGDGWHIPLVAKVAPAGDRIVFATVLGAKVQGGTLRQLAIDGQGGAVVAAETPGALFPLTAGAVLGSGFGALFKVGVGKFPTLVQASANPAGPGQPIALRAAVQSATPGGTVTFRNGTDVLGTASPTQGTASLIVTLPPGVHRISAAYSADGLVSPPHFQLVRGQ